MASNEQPQGGGDVIEDEIAGMSPEEQMFHYASKGDGNNLATVLNNAPKSGLDINAKDDEGLSAMGIAVKNGFVLPLMHLLDHGAKLTDTLLRAVDGDFEEAVIVIVDYANKQPRAERDAILKCKCETTDIHPDVTPIIRAAQKNNFALVKILHEVGLRVEEIGEEDLDAKTNDSLQRSVGTLEIYKALASPAYVCFDRDPIGRAFHLSMLLRKLALLEVEFSLTYLELANGMEQYAADILGCAMTTEEVMAILTYHGKGSAVKSDKEVKALGLLPTINRAIAHGQKKFVAEPTCQHALRIQFARQLISLQDRPFVLSIILRILIIMLFPIICIVYKLGVSEKCDQFVKIPMVKFFMQLASDLFLLGMIMYEISVDKEADQQHDLRPWHYMIYFYGLAMLWREILYIWKKRHQRNVISAMNIVNMMIGLLLVVLINNQIVWNAENADTEWKFHRTRLWMSFLDETFTVPPPFNLLPNLMPTLRHCGARIKKCVCCLYCRRRKKPSLNHINAERDEISMDSISTADTNSRNNIVEPRVDKKTYKRAVVTLVERYISARTSHERTLEGDISVADMRNLKNDVIGLRYNLFKEVWCINEKLSFGHTESEGINTEMTTVQDIFTALARNKQDLESFERDVRIWLMDMVKRLQYLPDVDMLEISIPSAARSIRRRQSNTVEEMVGYYESLKRQKSQRKKRKLLADLMKPLPE